MLKLVFAITATLMSQSAFADDGHFDIPNWVKPSGQPSNAGGYQVNGMNPPDCSNKPQLLAWLKDWRQRARQGYAELVARNIPSLNGTSSCINKKEAVDAKYEKNGAKDEKNVDYWVVTCLAQKKGTVTHLFKMELLVQPGECLSDAKLTAFVNSPQCPHPGEVQRFVNLVMSPCQIGSNPPKLRSGNAVFDMDINFINHLMNKRPAIRNIVNVVDQDVRVKGSPGGGSGAGSSSGSASEDSNCNAGGCFPGAKPAK